MPQLQIDCCNIAVTLIDLDTNGLRQWGASRVQLEERLCGAREMGVESCRFQSERGTRLKQREGRPMKRKPSVYTGAWLIGLALVLLILFARQTTQAQEVNALPSLSGWVGVDTPYKAWTYASDRLDGVILMVNESEKPCRSHHAPPAHRNPDRPRHPRGTNRGNGNRNRNPSPCEEQQSAKSRRRLRRGRGV